MKILSKAAAAALVAGTLGLAAFTPAAFAQTQAQPQPQPPAAASDGTGQQNDTARPGERRQRGFSFHRQQGYRGAMGRGVMGLVCSQRGAERLDRMFGALSNRARLTDAQRPAFDELRSTALAAQTEFADACLEARDAIRAGGSRPDPVKGLQTRLAIDSARVEAMNQVLPKFEAFYNALTDEQKSALQPRRQRGFDFHRDRRNPGRMHPMNNENAEG
jgi:hypothetical protein